MIEETIREKLPEGFQRAEYLLEHGMVDMVVPPQRAARHPDPGARLLGRPNRRRDRDAADAEPESAAAAVEAEPVDPVEAELSRPTSAQTQSGETLSLPATARYR